MAKELQYANVAALTVLLLGGLLTVEGRLFYLQVLRHDDLGSIAARYDRFEREPEPRRGEIRDRHGQPLVLSLPVNQVYADLSVCTNRPETCARILADALHLDARALAARFRPALPPGAKARQAICVKRNVTEAEWLAVSNAMARGDFGWTGQPLKRKERVLLNRLRYQAIFVAEDQMRLYVPEARSLGPVVGFTGIGADGRGLAGASGIESTYDGLLAGKRGKWISKKTASGTELPFLRESWEAPQDGYHLQLTIDLRLQLICANALASACEQHAPSNATVLVMQPATGEILAWVSWPYQDPERPPDAPVAEFRNHAIMDCYEPGSTFKMITLAAALNEKIATLDQRWDGERGRFRFAGAVLHDRRPFGILTVREALAQSVNVIFAKLGLNLGPVRFERYLAQFGFGQPTGVGLAGEASGQINRRRDRPLVTLSRWAIGQAIGPTQMQMIAAAGALANQGCRMRPLLAERVVDNRGTVHYLNRPVAAGAVVTPETARQVLDGLTEVVSPRGTGGAAALETHTVAGKTGTAQIANEDGYLADRYYASFIGFVPANQPRLVILVAFSCPQNGHGGGAVAAPVFRKIARQAVDYLGIPPDKTVVPDGLRAPPAQNASPGAYVVSAH